MKKTKHVKLFEDFSSSESQLGFAPEDISRPGDTVFCWNFEDGWEVALLDGENSEKMYAFLQSVKDNLVTGEIQSSSKPGIAFVTAGVPYDLDVRYEGPDFDPSMISYLINGENVEENPNEVEAETSCIFTLKRNHVISYKWNGGYSTVSPVETYLENSGS